MHLNYDVALLDALLQFVRKHQLIRPGDRVGVAVSGGADSVALLRALLGLRSELGCILSVVHLHHGLRGADADADAEFVQHLAEEHHLELHFSKRDVRTLALESRQSLEAAGRSARLQFFAALCSGGVVDRIATAHTANDQAETVLLKLLRGAGTRGLSGIFPVARQVGATLVRPLLDVTRNEIEAYLRDVHQPWREDATNRSPEFVRNRIRHEVLPLLVREFNPSLIESLCTTADVAREEQQFWDSTIQGVIGDLRNGIGSFDLALFSTLHTAVQRRVLMGVAPQALDFDHVERVREFILQSQVGEREVARGLRVRLLRDSAGRSSFAFVTEQPKAEPYSLSLQLPGQVEVPARHSQLVSRRVQSHRYGTTLAASLAGRTLTIRNWRPGDRFQPVGRSEGTLKEFFQQIHVPATARPSWPVAELDGEIIWVLGLNVGAPYVSENEDGFVIEEITADAPREEEVTSQDALGSGE